MASLIASATETSDGGTAVKEFKEFNMCIIGCPSVGKTSLMKRLTGIPFNRKNSSKPTLDEEATRYSIEGITSAGLVVFHFFDWGWEQKRREQNINQQLMKGNDGALFMYDVTERRSLQDFTSFSDWYQRAAGFDKPFLIISNKNDQKKRAVQDGEGQAVARAGDRRDYIALSLVDDTGVDELMVSLCRLMLQDVNLSVVGSFKAASAETLTASDNRAAAKNSNIGLDIAYTKTKKVLLLALNSAVIARFTEELSVSCDYIVEPVGSLDLCEEEIKTGGVYSLLAPPSSTASQIAGLELLAKTYDIGYVSAIPKNAFDALNNLKIIG